MRRTAVKELERAPIVPSVFKGSVGQSQGWIILDKDREHVVEHVVEHEVIEVIKMYQRVVRTDWGRRCDAEEGACEYADENRHDSECVKHANLAQQYDN